MSEDNRPTNLVASNPGAVLSADMRRQIALDMRADGQAYRAIGLALGLSVAQAYRLVNDAWERLNEDSDEGRRVLRSIEEDKLDASVRQIQRIIAQLEPLAFDTTIVFMATRMEMDGPVEVQVDPTETRIKAMDALLKCEDRLLKIAARRARLRGLDAPTQMEVKTSKVVPLAELRAKLDEIRAKRAEREAKMFGDTRQQLS